MITSLLFGQAPALPTFNNMYTITIEDLRLMTHVGWSRGEQAAPRVVTLSLQLEVNAQKVASTDDLVDTVDYAAVISSLKQLFENGKWRLLETLASEVSKMLLESFPKIERVSLTVAKDIEALSKSVKVSYQRSRTDV